MELRTLKTFQRVAQLHSFSKAAIELGYTQAAVTIQIQQLEAELGTKLFDRFHKKTVLTKKGELFYQHVCTILEEEKKAILSINNQKILEGTLRIGLTESLSSSLFPMIINTFHKTHPTIKLVIETASPKSLLERMNQNFLDIVYFIDRKKYHKNWVKVLEESEEIVFVTSPSNPLAKRKHLALEDLFTQELLLTEKDVSYRETLDQYVLSHGKELIPYLEIGNTDFIIQQLLLGNGISFLPHYCVQKYLEEGMLVTLHPKDFQMYTWRQVVYHKGKWMTPEMEAFLPLLIQWQA